ncbi:putative MATE family efflux protein [Caldicoprobacter guelmensis]|uniref:MATE family efflux transporter n=1 Tax=Caldicoprobacter guelmensis TaxID=1170224 RepID=UPI001FAFBF7B|nr:MATE family efflux transporter [Caldicoprobacter guelmensis]MBM7582159.1 putative MATE family efflux protein [Caldicoprobacter guelmensis]
MNVRLENLMLKHRSHEPGQPVRLALELVEPGDLESCQQPERVTKQLPPGITSRMLYRDIIRIAWPAFLEFILTQLVSMVDMMMVGQLGPWAIAAVGLTNQPKFLLMTMFMAMNVGATALVARYKGEGDQLKANMVLRQALLLTFVLSAVSSIIGFVFAEPMVRFMGAADEQTLAGGTIYLKIQMVGFVVLALTSTITAALRGIGDSRTAMIYNLTANVVNVIFNYMLIYGHFGFPRLEVAGASIATVIGQCVAFVLAALSILGANRYLSISLKDDFRPKWDIIKSIFNIGMPAVVEQLVMRVGMIAYSITVASLGTVAFATHNVCMNIQSMSFMNGQAFGVSATSLMGQSLGRRRPDMAQAYSRYTRRMGMIVSLVLAAIFILFGEEIVKLYTDDETVIEDGANILKFVAIMQPFQSSQLILSGALRGAGDTRAIAWIIFITVLLVRPGLAMFTIHVLGWGLVGAWIALMADQFLRSFLVVLRFNSGKWKTIKV